LGATLQPAAAVVLFSLGLALVHEAGLFPFAFYAGHALEVRYGLSGRTARGWLTAHVKATGIGTALTVLAALVVWGAASVSPAGWWVLAWGAVSAAAVAGAWLAPILILPLFYRLSPLPGPVTDRLSRLAAQAGVPVLGVFAWRAGEGTTKANAALAGLGRTRRILVSDTLLADYSGEELDAVLAHELAHHVHHDLWRVLALDAAVAWLALWAAARAQAVLAGPLGLAGPADPAGLPLVALVMLVVSAAALPLVNAVSRMHERRADSFALDLTGEPAAFAGAVRRLAAQHLVEEEPAWLTRLFFSTHPPVCERLARARDWGRG
jgi:STE24 endopeptidase